jgi:hypothetical protein
MLVVLAMIITPIARELLEIRAMAASPLIFLLSLMRIRINASNSTNRMLTDNGATFSDMAIASVPKPTWERPSPIIE